MCDYRMHRSDERENDGTYVTSSGGTGEGIGEDSLGGGSLTRCWAEASLLLLLQLLLIGAASVFEQHCSAPSSRSFTFTSSACGCTLIWPNGWDFFSSFWRWRTAGCWCAPAPAGGFFFITCSRRADEFMTIRGWASPIFFSRDKVVCLICTFFLSFFSNDDNLDLIVNS